MDSSSQRRVAQDMLPVHCGEACRSLSRSSIHRRKLLTKAIAMSGRMRWVRTPMSLIATQIKEAP